MEGERLKSFMGCLNCISAAVIQLNTCILSPGSLLATGTCSSPAFSLAVGKLPIAGELLLVSCALLALWIPELPSSNLQPQLGLAWSCSPSRPHHTSAVIRDLARTYQRGLWIRFCSVTSYGVDLLNLQSSNPSLSSASQWLNGAASLFSHLGPNLCECWAIWENVLNLHNRFVQTKQSHQNLTWACQYPPLYQ